MIPKIITSVNMEYNKWAPQFQPTAQRLRVTLGSKMSVPGKSHGSQWCNHRRSSRHNRGIASFSWPLSLVTLGVILPDYIKTFPAAMSGTSPIS